MEPNTKYAELFEQLEQEAIDNKRGMWSDPDVVQGRAPKLTELDYQQELVEAETDHKYIASKNSDVFHLPSFRWAKRISEENKERFHTLDEAVNSDRRPCRVCKPDESENNSD